MVIAPPKHRNQNNNNHKWISRIAIGIINLLLLLFVTYRSSSSTSTSRQTMSTLQQSQDEHPSLLPTHNVFSLLVELRFASPQHVETFQQAIQPLCEYVRKHESGTLAYEILLSDKDPMRVLLLERYQSKEYYLQVHRNSPEFLQFRPQLQALQDAGHVEIRGESYYDSGWGFGDRLVASSRS